MKRIVIVDDEYDIAKNMNSFFKLKFPNCESMFFSDSQVALNYLSENPTDILITDINMPRLSGIDLVKELNKMNQHPTILVVSGFCSKAFESELCKISDVSFFTKPVLMKTLSNKIEEKLNA